MVLQPLALVLVIHAFHPRVDFPAGQKRCVKMCQHGCSMNRSEKQSSCVKLAGQRGPPWINPSASPDNLAFKYKWCRTKYQMASAAVLPIDEGLFHATKYPRTGLDSGEFAEVDHVDWVTPKCNMTTAPSCKRVQRTLVDEKLKWWLIDEAETCRALDSEQMCADDCTKFCLTLCDCGWGKGAVIAYETGHFQRYRYENLRGKGACVKAYKFDKKCTCSHGIAADSATCLSHGKEQCSGCFHGYTLENNTMHCISTQCNCLNGTPVNSTTCSKHGAHECETCNGNYYLAGFYEKICRANKCVCENGDPVDNTGCKANGMNVCARCNEFFHRVMHQGLPRCDANVCNCLHGLAVDSSSCTVHHGNECQSCDAKYHLDQRYPQQCEENQCKCRNGTPVSSITCAVHGANVCKSCEATFHFNETAKSCDENKCVCDNGEAVKRESCETNQENVCASCSEHYHLEGSRCAENVCVCGNGAAVTNLMCTKHKSNECRNCNPTFHLNTETKECNENVCKCPNGSPVANANCSRHQNTECAFCMQHYHATSERTCEANVCHCPEGRPVPSHKCVVHNAKVCDRSWSCKPLFHFDHNSQICEANVCKCEFGESVSSDECTRHDGNECQSCHSGYEMGDNKICRERSCPMVAPEHGMIEPCKTTLASGQRCRPTCNLRYHAVGETTCKLGVLTNLVCKENRCLCDNGSPVSNSDCTEDGANECQFCLRGFQMNAVTKSCEACGSMFIPNSMTIPILFGPQDFVGHHLNDQVYGLRVKEGYVVELFQHIYFDGEKLTFHGGLSKLEGKWRTLVSSYKCSKVGACPSNHDSSKCLEHGGRDADCCARFGAGSCDDGFAWSIGRQGCKVRDTKSNNYGSCCIPAVRVSLIGGAVESEGNVHVDGKPVCDDIWDDTHANVVCKSLGYSAGVSTTQSHFGNVADDFSMDQVRCTGRETHIKSCIHARTDDCSGGEGAGVKCSLVLGDHCWTECGGAGPCDHACGIGNKCCRKNWEGGKNGCTLSEGGYNRHECVKGPGSR